MAVQPTVCNLPMPPMLPETAHLLASLPPPQGSQWIDSSVQQRFEPFSECAAGHVAGGCRGAAVAAAAALCSGSCWDQLLLSGLLAST